MSKRIWIFSIIFSLFFIIFLSNISYAGTQKWNSLDFDVKINDDGSMNVTETWDIYVSNTNTLFKDYKLDYNKFSGITDVEVSRVESGEEIPLTQIYEEQYHVDSGYYYGMILPSNSSKFEIAWNVGLDSSSDNRIYKIHYKVLDAVKIYNDCTEVYWQFLGKDNTMIGKNVTGTITLPRDVSDIEKLRVWAHGNLTGDIQKISTNTVKFTLPQITANEMLEIRIVTDENIYLETDNKYSYSMLDNIISEETKWADEANAIREKAKATLLVYEVIYGLVVVFFLLKIIKYLKQGKELKEKYTYNTEDLKYFRDIPMKDPTPVRASYFCFFKKNTSNFSTSNAFSATILQLALKKIISFEPIDKKNVRIVFLKNNEDDKNQLYKEERIVYNLVKRASKDNDSITTEELNKYAKRDYERIHGEMGVFEGAAREYAYEEKHYIDEEREKISRRVQSKVIWYILAIIFIMFITTSSGNAGVVMFSIPIFIELFICVKLCSSNAKKVNILTQEGDELSRRWKGLKNYMEDFSLLKEKQVPDLILWEQYLVYATAFGISKKVMEQLKVVYPELSDPNYYDGRYTYMHYMANPAFDGTNFVSNIGNSFSNIYNSASSAYNAAHSSSSSGSGGGGGFSGGGGGRRWRRKCRRKIKMKRWQY